MAADGTALRKIWFQGFDMRIVFDPNTLHQSKRGSVTGVVYFAFGTERQFPAAGWNDFVIVVGSWWMAALKQVTEERVQADLRFMDGPFWITAVPRGASLVLRCTEDRSHAGGVYEVMVSTSDFQHELTAFAREVSEACARAGIDSADLDQLRRFLQH